MFAKERLEALLYRVSCTVKPIGIYTYDPNLDPLNANLDPCFYPPFP
jgi:hypothetical protein